MPDLKVCTATLSDFPGCTAEYAYIIPPKFSALRG
jgi:hypothetical protein